MGAGLWPLSAALPKGPALWAGIFTFQRVFRKRFGESAELLGKLGILGAAHFSAGSSNSNWRGRKPASNAFSGGRSSQVIVRSNTALSAHKLICQVRRRLLKNIWPNPAQSNLIRPLKWKNQEICNHSQGLPAPLPQPNPTQSDRGKENLARLATSTPFPHFCSFRSKSRIGNIINI